MKTSNARCERFQYRLLNKNKPTGLLLFIFAVVAIEPIYAANNGTVRFHGSITQASCEVGNTAQAGGAGRLISVAPGISVTVSAADNACSDSVAAFSVAYKALPVAAPDARMQVGPGVVTLTYE